MEKQKIYQMDWEELMKLMILFPIYIAFVGILYLEIEAGWITKEVLFSSLFSWLCLVIGYYWGKKVVKLNLEDKQ